jgi:Uncharacterized conserved protein, contains RING Zn-finger
MTTTGNNNNIDNDNDHKGISGSNRRTSSGNDTSPTNEHSIAAEATQQGNSAKGQKSRNRNRNRNRNRKDDSKRPSPNGPNQEKRTVSLSHSFEDQCQIDKQKEEEVDDEHVPEHHHCLVCYSPHLHEERGILPCGHDSVCASCHLRLRSLLSDKRCPICKASNEEIIIDADADPSVDRHKGFHEYEKWGNDIGPNYIFRQDVGMFFPMSYYNTKVLPIFSLSCNVARCNFMNDSSESNSPGTLRALKNHLASAHNPPLQLCDLCIEHKRDFISRLPRFTANQLKEHNKYGDMGAGRKATGSGRANKGHPICQFCQPKRFYDLTELHKHLHKEHFECFVCKKLGKPLQFFKNYDKLNLHFDREHYLCRFPECLAARFVVFSNDIDLKAHERDVHGLTGGGSTKIQMEFRVRPSGRDGSGVAAQQQQVQQVPNMRDDFNYGLDGEVFVPDSLDDVNNSNGSNPDDGNENGQYHQQVEITHGPHAERTAMLREQARLRREELGLGNENDGLNGSNEAFPTLGSQGSGNTVSWIRDGGRSTVAALKGRNATALNEENFPSLGPATKTSNSRLASKLRVTKGNGSNQLSAITRVANVASHSSRSFANAAIVSGMAKYSVTTLPSSSSYAASNRVSKANLLSSDNFPSLGACTSGVGTGANKYSAAQAYATKQSSKKAADLNQNFNEHFPEASFSASKTSSAKKISIFDKKPPAQIATDNFLAFPPPSSMKSVDGKEQVEAMKQLLGQEKYKQLKRNTKDFATGSLDPESYVTLAMSLFAQGIKDPALWEYIPNLISSCPNESQNKRALRYLESLRYSSGINSETKQLSSNNRKQSVASGWTSTVLTSGTSIASARQSESSQATVYGTSASAKHPILPSISDRSVPSVQVNSNNDWNGNNKSVAAISNTKSGNVIAPAARSGTQTVKKKSNESKSVPKQSNGNKDSKKKAKEKKNELRNLAFGKV